MKNIDTTLIEKRSQVMIEVDSQETRKELKKYALLNDINMRDAVAKLLKDCKGKK